jgi:hypothetical protein
MPSPLSPSRLRSRSRLQRLVEQGEEFPPVPLGRDLVIDGEVRHREAVPRARINLETVINSRLGQQFVETLRHLRRIAVVEVGSGDIDAGRDFRDDA